MSQIKISNLTFSYDGSYENVFENVSFTIDTDWRLGFTGRNGRGKTTFLNLLMGKYDYKGTISYTTDFDYFPFHVSDMSKTAIEIIEEIRPDYVYWKISCELSLLGLDDSILYRPFAKLSGGEQTKVMLAVLFAQDNKFLLIDEPTNHLDEKARELLANYLKNKTGFILVSHDRSFLDACTDHTLSINKTNIEIEHGNFSSWLANKERRDNFEAAENTKLKKEINRLKKTAAEKSQWSDKTEKTKFNNKNSGLHVDRGYVGHKSAKMMSRAKNYEARAEKAVAEKSKLMKNTENIETLKISPLDYHSELLAYLKDVSVFYGQRSVFQHISFDIKKGDRIALKGGNGCGKSSIIKLLCGEYIPYSGEYKTGSGLIISYVPQDTSHLNGNLKNFARDNGIDETLFKAILRKLDFSREQFDRDINLLSDGQKKKILIAKSLSQKAHLYIWDEPLNYIDIFSRIQLETLILTFKPTLLFVEHDKTFSDKIASKVVNIQKQNIK